MVERSCRTCTYCGEPVNEDYSFTLDHTAGFYGAHAFKEKEMTIVREGIFCTRSCLIRWLLDPEAGEDKAGIGTSGRDALGLIIEIGHSLDEINLGWAQKEDWRIELGLGDARRELEELKNLIVKPDAGEKADDETEENALKVLDNPRSTPAQRTDARIILGMPEAEAMKMEEAEDGTHTLEAAKNQIKKLIEEVDEISVDPIAYQVLSTLNIKEKLENTLQILEAEG